ncbi:MAG: hypothetical protein ABR948_11965, partial [Bradyrhizobium sp.]
GRGHSAPVFINYGYVRSIGDDSNADFVLHKNPICALNKANPNGSYCSRSRIQHRFIENCNNGNSQPETDRPASAPIL